MAKLGDVWVFADMCMLDSNIHCVSIYMYIIDIYTHLYICIEVYVYIYIISYTYKRTIARAHGRDCRRSCYARNIVIVVVQTTVAMAIRT